MRETLAKRLGYPQNQINTAQRHLARVCVCVRLNGGRHVG